MEELSTMTKKEMLAKVEFLKEQLTGNMFEDMEAILVKEGFIDFQNGILTTE